MITKAPSFVTEDKQTFLTLEAAQGHELAQLWEKNQPAKMEDVPLWVWNYREKIVEIITMKATSRPRARKANRKASPAAVNRALQDGKQ